MQFKLTIEPTGLQRTIPINYQYEVSAWIYKTIRFGNGGFGEWLHSQGYMEEIKIHVFHQ